MNNEAFACKSKRKYHTNVDALLTAAKRPGVVLRSYRCKVCRFYHLTSKKVK